MEETGLLWRVAHAEKCTLAHFVAARPDGLLDYRTLSEIRLPAELKGCEASGLVFSGRGPVWLYAYLCHCAHGFAWLAVMDPRLDGAVVVQRHRPGAPGLGSLIPRSDLPAVETAD